MAGCAAAPASQMVDQKRKDDPSPGAQWSEGAIENGRLEWEERLFLGGKWEFYAYPPVEDFSRAVPVPSLIPGELGLPREQFNVLRRRLQRMASISSIREDTRRSKNA